MKKSSTASRVSLTRILGVVGPIVLIVFLVLHQANFLLGRSLLIAFGDNESTYSNAWFEWDGDIVAKNVSIHPSGEEDDFTIRFERVHLETPGWFWFVRNTFDRKLARAKLDRIHVTLGGGTSINPFDPTLGDLGPFSLAAASPFEAEGCMEDAYWLREELVEMGLQPGPTTLEFDYRVDGTQLLTTITLDTPNVSRVRYDREEQLGERINALLIDQYSSFAKSERWQVEDQGFVKARNLWCAKKDGTTVMQFVQRHTDSVERLLEMYGLAVDAATRDAYAGFARNGGKLVFAGDYIEPLHSDLFYDLRATGEALPGMNSRIEHGAQRVALSWSEFDPRPLAGFDTDDNGATFALLQRERAAAAPESAAGSPVAAAATPPMPAGTTPTTTSAVTETSPTAAAPSKASATASAPTPAPAVVTTATSVAPPAAIELRWSDLAQYKGRRLRIWTRHNPPRNVELLEVGAQQIRVQARLGGGHAQYSIGRDSFSRAMLLP